MDIAKAKTLAFINSRVSYFAGLFIYASLTLSSETNR